MGLKLLCVTDKRDTLVALSQKSENLSRLKTTAPWINFCGAFAMSIDLSVVGFRFIGMRSSPELIPLTADNPLLVRET